MSKPIGGASGPAATTSMAGDDTFIIWRDANNDVRVITKDNLFGGTVSLLGTAQTYSALKTFSAGISLGAETLSVYDEGTWTPAITGATSDPTVTYTAQTGTYTRIGNVVFYNFRIILDTFSGGSGSLRISTPHTVNAVYTTGVALLRGVDLPAGVGGVVFSPSTFSPFGVFNALVDNDNSTILDVSSFATGDELRASGFYFV